MEVLASAVRTGRHLAVLVLLAGIVAWSAARLDARVHGTDADEELVYLPEARFLRAVALGYNNALADLLWFRTISYFGRHYRSDRLYPWLAHMCDLVTDLDPQAEHVYRFGGVLLPWEADQVDAGIKLLEKGNEALPESWVIPFWLGFNEYYFKHDYDKALAAAREATNRPGVHPIATRFAATLAAKQYGPELAEEFLTQMEEETDRADVRAVIRHQIRRARAANDIAKLKRAVALYRERFGGLPSSLDLLVREGILPSIPSDPFGGVYELNPATGAVRSSTRMRPLPLHDSEAAETGQSRAAPRAGR